MRTPNIEHQGPCAPSQALRNQLRSSKFDPAGRMAELADARDLKQPVPTLQNNAPSCKTVHVSFKRPPVILASCTLVILRAKFGHAPRHAAASPLDNFRQPFLVVQVRVRLHGQRDRRMPCQRLGVLCRHAREGKAGDKEWCRAWKSRRYPLSSSSLIPAACRSRRSISAALLNQRPGKSFPRLSLAYAAIGKPAGDRLSGFLFVSALAADNQGGIIQAVVREACDLAGSQAAVASPPVYERSKPWLVVPCRPSLLR